jgi:hypothetical protein
MRDLVECLTEWLSMNRSDANAWRILSALAQETLKRVDSADPAQREFDVLELAQATETDRDWDYDGAKRWFVRANPRSFMDARTSAMENYFRDRGHEQAIRIAQRETKGRHRAAWFLEAYVLPADGPQDQFEVAADGQPSRTGSGPVHLSVAYDLTAPSNLKLSPVGQVLLGKGEFLTRSPRGAAWAVLMLGSVALLIYCGYLFWQMRLVARPLLTSDLAILLMLLFAIWVYWRFLVRPWGWLLEDRIVPAAEILLGFAEDPVQIELATTGVRKMIRVVRYSGVCPICAGTLELRYGYGSNCRRLFGCCDEAPHDHVFTFDRVTRIGRRYDWSSQPT